MSERKRLEHENAIGLAETQIRDILGNLELETGMLVKEIHLRSVEITTRNDVRKQYQQSVEIEMYRLPGHQW